MSHFTSIKIKVNENDHLGTLLAEYGGDFEIKVWILDKCDAWAGELSSVDAQQFISSNNIPKENFIEELKKALTSSDPEVLYSIDKTEDKGHVFSWKKRFETGIIMKNGEITLEKVSRKDIYEEVIERSFEHNSLLQSRIDVLQKEKDSLLKEKEAVLTSFEKAVNEKQNFERNVYSQFLLVLNAKKEKISELQESLDALTQLKENPSNKVAQKAVKKEPPQQETSKRSLRNMKDKKKVSKPYEEVDPFEVDTDIEEEGLDVSTPRPSKRESDEAGSQSFNLDSFDEVSSPVAILPKRSKLNPKNVVKRNKSPSSPKPPENVETGEDLIDQL